MRSPAGPTAIRVDPAIEADCALRTIERLDEIPGIGVHNAQVILAEIGLDMSRFPTPEHLVSWAKLCPRTIQSGPVTRAGKTGKGNPYLKARSARPPPRPPRPTPSSANATGASSNAAASSRPWSRSPAPSWSSSGTCWPTRPPASATSAPTTTPTESTTERRLRNHIAQLTAMGYRVTVEPAA